LSSAEWLQIRFQPFQLITDQDHPLAFGALFDFSEACDADFMFGQAAYPIYRLRGIGNDPAVDKATCRQARLVGDQRHGPESGGFFLGRLFFRGLFLDGFFLGCFFLYGLLFDSLFLAGRRFNYLLTFFESKRIQVGLFRQ
jgi:hypothetical protein